jgi:hypothetical protein
MNSLTRHRSIVIRVIENQITTLRPYNARYTGDHRSIFRKRYTEMITRVSLVLCDLNTEQVILVAMRRLVGFWAPGRDVVMMEGPLGAHGGVWKASRDPALPRSPVRRVAAGNRHPAGRSPSRIAVRRRAAEVSGMSRLRDRYPWLPWGSALTLISGWSRRLAAMS